MAAAHALLHDELLALVAKSLCTRTLDTFARESRLDGESLAEAVERYEVDYAWHVLGSSRLRDETIARLEAKLQHAASDSHQATVAAVLKAAAMSQPPELLMSFDNDVAEHLAALLHARQPRGATVDAEAVS